MSATVGAASLPANADEPDTSTPTPEVVVENEPGQEVRFGPTLEDSVLIGITGDQPMTPFLLDIADVAACDGVNDENWVITTYSTLPYDDGSPWGAAWSGGNIDLKCGSDYTSGYKHIRSGHQWGSVIHPNSWEALRASASEALGYTSPPSWDDYMNHAIGETFTYANPYPSTIANAKVCFSAPYHIWQGEQIFSSWYANTIVSSNNRLVITAYLSDNYYSTDCYED